MSSLLEQSGLSQEDHIALTLKALLYSHHHIDLSIALEPEPGQGESPREAADRVQARLTALAAPRVEQLSQHAHTRGKTVLVRPVSTDEDNPSVSEDGLDTVAVLVSGGELVVAANYRTRRAKPAWNERTQAYAFTDFDKLGLAGVRDDLAEVGSQLQVILQEDGLVDTLKLERLVFIARTPAPTEALEEARAHAEMQLLSYARKHSWSPRGLRMGVSKACCLECAAELRTAGVIPRTTGERDTPPGGWDRPDLIDTQTVWTVELGGG